MRTSLSVSAVVLLFAVRVFAQGAAPATPAPGQKPPAQKPPATTAPPQRGARPPVAQAGVTVQVTDSSGLPLADVKVTAQGPTTREAVTAADGTVRFANMRAGAYRLRLTREGSITLERDITVKATEPLLVDVSMNPAPVPVKAPEPPRPAPAPEAAPKTLGPPTDPKLIPVPDFIEKNFIGRDGRKETGLACTTTGGATLIQLREALLNRSRADADEWIYVVAGEGTLRIANADQRLAAGTFALIPHTISNAIVPGGRTPLIFLSLLSGAGNCASATAGAPGR